MQLLTSGFELAFHFNPLKLGATLLIKSGMSSSRLGAVAFPESFEEPSGTQSYFFGVTMDWILCISAPPSTEGVWKHLQVRYDF